MKLTIYLIKISILSRLLACFTSCFTKGATTNSSTNKASTVSLTSIMRNETPSMIENAYRKLEPVSNHPIKNEFDNRFGVIIPKANKRYNPDLKTIFQKSAESHPLLSRELMRN